MRLFDTTNSRTAWQVLGGSERSQAAIMTLPPDESTGGPDNRHENSDQWLYVISGRGEATVDGEEVAFATGALLLIEAGQTHEIRNPGRQPLVTVNIYAPPEY